jgi:hypothetical protein
MFHWLKINGRRLVGTTLLKRYHVLVADGYSIYGKLCFKTCLHVLVLSGKTVQIDHRHTDPSTYRQMKKGPRRPSPLGRGVNNTS